MALLKFIKIMRKIAALLVVLVAFAACKSEKKEPANDIVKEEVTYASFGKEIVADDAVAAKSMAKHYKDMSVGDSIPSKMIATVEEVCQAKGCWMKLKLEDDSQVMVKFKDYAFFVPKNIAGKEVIINGQAFVTETSVDQLRHIAEDGGKTTEEIEAITEPKKEYAFLADGVLLKEE